MVNQDAAAHLAHARRTPATPTPTPAPPQALLLASQIGNHAFSALARDYLDWERHNGDGGTATAPAPTGASTASPAQSGGTAGVPGEGRQVAVQPVIFKSDATDTSPTGVSCSRRMASTRTIWGKLGVMFTTADPITIEDATLKTGGGDRASRDAVRATWSGSGVGVFFVDNDIADAGGGGTVGGGADGSKIALSDRGSSDTLLAHEMGHSLGLGHPPSDADDNTIMTPSGSNSGANPTRNTIGNYNRITWPAPDSSTIINPDP